MNDKSENNLPKIGYLYHNPKLVNPTGKYRLDIFISSIPTEQHFDVLHVTFFVKSSQGTIERLTITHPWNYEEAFTFGGQLKIDELEMQTVCVLVSSAPILKISGATSLRRLFIDELEIILAERQATYSNHDEYEAILIKTEPFELYLACLNELISKFEQFPQTESEYHQLLLFLHSQKYRLDAVGLSKDPAPNLDDLFG
jgi:hypothetical protein